MSAVVVDFFTLLLLVRVFDVCELHFDDTELGACASAVMLMPTRLPVMVNFPACNDCHFCNNCRLVVMHVG